MGVLGDDVITTGNRSSRRLGQLGRDHSLKLFSAPLGDALSCCDTQLYCCNVISLAPPWRDINIRIPNLGLSLQMLLEVTKGKEFYIPVPPRKSRSIRSKMAAEPF